MPPKWLKAQLPKQGHSSLMNIPRSFTFGSPSVNAPFFIYTSLCRRVGTSANQYHGDTPICLDSSYAP